MAKTKSRGFIREWLVLAGLKQSDLVKLLDWSKAKANAVWHGDQRINEDMLEEIAPLVNARTYELLMHPDSAHQFRRLEAALAAAGRPAQPEPAPTPLPAPRRKAG
jgi:transcriptional regulator with XRE-family HTH domain